VDDVWIWSNIVINHWGAGIIAWHRLDDTPATNINWSNNTVYGNGYSQTTSSWPYVSGGVTNDSDNSGETYKNNIFSDNRANAPAGSYNQIALIGTQVGDGALEHNTYYISGQTATMYYDGAQRSLATLQDTYDVEDDDPLGGGISDGEVADPGFTDPDGEDDINGTVDDDFTLDGTNINDGADLSQCFLVTIQGVEYRPCLEDGLDPLTTDWRTTPPRVNTQKQGSFGTGWERGAYIYVTPSQQNSPAGLRFGG
jgi:hypothetical protein